MTGKVIGDNLLIRRSAAICQEGKGIALKMRTRIRQLQDVPFITFLLVAANMVVFLLCTFTGQALYDGGDLSPASAIWDGQFYRLFTAMFLHADIYHIVNNMLLLAGLGYMLEGETGHIVFLILYMISGFGGQIVSLAYKIYVGEWYVASIGASGAVFGVVGVLLALSLCYGARLRSVNWQRVLIVVVYSIYSGIRASDIDNAAHIGGFATGFLAGLAVCLIWKLKEKRRR